MPTAGGLLRYCVLALVAAIITLPTGSVCGLPVKHVLMVLAVASLAVCRRGLRPTRLQIAAGLATAAAVSLWTAVGLANGATPTDIADHAIAIAITVAVPILLGLTDGAGIISRAALWQTVLAAGLAHATMKILVTVAIATGLVGTSQVLDAYRSVSGIAPVELGFGGGLHRLQLPNDLLSPLFMAWCGLHAWPPGTNSRLARLVRWVSAANLFITGSRYYFAALPFLGLRRHGDETTLPPGSRIRRVAMVAVLAGAAGFGACFVVGRILHDDNPTSDNTRIEQMRILVKSWREQPWLGHGFGSHPPGLVRDQLQPWSFESQWVALLYQTGLLGLLAAVLAVVIWGRTVLARNQRRGVSCLLMTWLIGCGLFNPALLGSVAGLAFALFMLPPEHRIRPDTTIPGSSP